VPASFRLRLVERTVARVKNRALVYVGLGNAQPPELRKANDFFRAGADVLVAHPPVNFPVAAELTGWYRALLDTLNGPFLIYNIPSTTKVSIPLETIGELIGHPRLAGVKDSENNPLRLEELLRLYGRRPDFSVFIGVGSFMLRGLELGAAGIVPSVGNLVPRACQDMCLAARRGDWAAAAECYSIMTGAASVYQGGRTLNESLAALKAAVHCRGLCEPHVLPPLLQLSTQEVEKLCGRISQLGLGAP
jgi:dihydrodipicolinate synthase/N-acetylneuraminate lyase